MMMIKRINGQGNLEIRSCQDAKIKVAGRGRLKVACGDLLSSSEVAHVAESLIVLSLHAVEFFLCKIQVICR